MASLHRFFIVFFTHCTFNFFRTVINLIIEITRTLISLTEKNENFFQKHKKFLPTGYVCKTGVKRLKKLIKSNQMNTDESGRFRFQFRTQ